MQFLLTRTCEHKYNLNYDVSGSYPGAESPLWA